MSARPAGRGALLFLGVFAGAVACHSAPRPDGVASHGLSVPIHEPRCADLPASARADSGCICPFGADCTCFYRTSRVAGGCLLEDWLLTDSYVARSEERLPDGGMAAVVGIYEPCIECWEDAGVVPSRSTGRVCGVLIACD